MKLLTQEILHLFQNTGRQEKNPDPLVIVRYFNPCGIGTWYATEYDPEDRLFYGYADIIEGEWGYFSLDELEEIRVPPFGLRIERDAQFTPTPISKACPRAIR